MTAIKKDFENGQICFRAFHRRGNQEEHLFSFELVDLAKYLQNKNIINGRFLFLSDGAFKLSKR